MPKISNPRELQSELDSILRYAQSDSPSRQKIAHQLRSLSARVNVASGPSVSGSGWKEINDGRGHRWVWDSGETSFHVTEFKGPGIPLYRLGLIVDLGSGHIGPLVFRRQLKSPEEMFAIAAAWYKNIESFRSGRSMGLDFTGDWNKA